MYKKSRKNRRSKKLRKTRKFGGNEIVFEGDDGDFTDIESKLQDYSEATTSTVVKNFYLNMKSRIKALFTNQVKEALKRGDPIRLRLVCSSQELDILNEIVHNPNNNYSIIKKIFTQV